ncbi:MAG: Kelch repeat-containing protein, partial [Actinomycetota bacterium]
FGPDMPFRAGSSASAVIEDQIYIAGGIDIDGDSTISTTAKLDPRTRAWTLLAPMPLPRHHAASATDGTRLYVFGGRGPGSRGGHVLAKGFDDVQVYDPATDSWTVSRPGPTAPAPLPQARGGTGKAVYAGGRFWVFGGETAGADTAGATRNEVYDRVDVYDPVTNTWTSGPPLPTARHGVLPVLRDGHIFVAGGGVRPGASRSRVLEILRLSIGPAERVRPED